MSTPNRPENYRVGQLLQLKIAMHGFVKLHQHFVHPGQIWEPLKIFWDCKENRYDWGVRVAGMPNSVPTGADEWVTAIKLECAWDVGCEYKIDQRDLAKEIIFCRGDMFMVMEVVVTPWKKQYRFAGGGEKRQRFSYVKFLVSLDGKPIYVYHDVSHLHGTHESVGIDTELFKLLL